MYQIATTSPIPSPDGGVTKGEYTYNGNGQRVKKIAAGVTTIFHYSLNGQIIAESNSAGTITAEYVYLNGQPLAKLEGASTYYYHNDHLGTPQKMTDASGTVVWAADYKPFGDATVTISTITNNLRFPGQYYDVETGNHYNRYRDYNPALDRYIEWDPIGLKGDELNLYAYVRNPLRFIDPWGLELQVTVQEGTGGTYGATVTVVNTNTNTTVFTGQGSSLPNNSTTQNTVATGTYGGTNTTRASGGPGIYIGETPTAPGSPRNTAYDIFVHCGTSQTNRGSRGCLTINPDQCQEFFRNFTPEQPVTVNVRR